MSEKSVPGSSVPHISGAYRAWVLFVLVLVYTFNFIDRQILSILKDPIKADLNLTDADLGLVGGPAFALLYAGLGIPIARLADRSNRVWIMTASLTLWSGMTAVCGVAKNFTHLFLARMGVAVGEAGGVAPAYSIIADYFPPKQRATALSIYSFGIPIGSAIGIVLGGILLDLIGWRQAFIIVGLLGIAVAPLFLFTVREPVRGQFDPGAKPTDKASFREVLRTILPKPSFWLMAFGAASSSTMGYGLIFWLPSFYIRSFGDALPGFFSWMPSFMLPDNPSVALYAAYFFGSILLVGGIFGVWLGGMLADKFGEKDKGSYALIPAVAFTAMIPLFLIGVLSNSLPILFVSWLAVQVLSLIWLGPIISAFQHIVPPHMRTTASAIFLFINNLLGYAVGTWLLGVMSDGLRVRFADDSLRYSLLCGVIFYAIAAVLMFLASRRLEKDWHRG